MEAYTAASEISNTELKTNHPIRLELALKFSIFHFWTLNDPAKACNLAKQALDDAKQALDDAIADIEHIDDDQYKESTEIM